MRLWKYIVSLFPTAVPAWLNPVNVKAELMPQQDKGSGLDLFRLTETLWFVINGIICGIPHGECVDFGSIPVMFHWFARPTELELRVAYAKHDGGYTLQGGRRRYKADVHISAPLNMCPQSRLRLDYELMVDIIVCKLAGRWNPLRGAFRKVTARPRWKVIMLRLLCVLKNLLGLVLHPLRAVVIFLVVRAAGRKAWNTIEPETEVYRAR